MSVCWPETTIKIVVSGTAQKSIFRRAKPKKWNLGDEISRFAEAHKGLSERSRFFYFYAWRPETPIFVVFSRRHEATSSKMPFSENL